MYQTQACHFVTYQLCFTYFMKSASKVELLIIAHRCQICSFLDIFILSVVNFKILPLILSLLSDMPEKGHLLLKPFVIKLHTEINLFVVDSRCRQRYRQCSHHGDTIQAIPSHYLPSHTLQSQTIVLVSLYIISIVGQHCLN